MLGLVALVFVAVVLQQLTPESWFAAPHKSRPLPELMVQGWINTAAPPTRELLRGKWLIVSLWQVNCPSCHYETPLLAKINRAIADRDDIVLLSFNTSPTEGIELVQRYVDAAPGYDWPVGVGAQLMSEVLEAPYTPALFLFGPDGQSVWQGNFADRLVRQLVKQAGVDAAKLNES